MNMPTDPMEIEVKVSIIKVNVNHVPTVFIYKENKTREMTLK